MLRIPPDELFALREKVKKARILEECDRYEDNFDAFFKAAWPSIDSADYQDSWAITAFCDHLEAVAKGHIKRLLVNYPPRCSKSSIVSIAWPAWIWARSERLFTSGPQVKFMNVSYNDRLAHEFSTRTRRLIESPWYQAHWGARFKLREDQNTKGKFDNTRGGSRTALSIGGGLLGTGYDCLSIDDPHATDTERKIETDADRMKVHSRWRELSSTRRNDPKRSAIVVTMQRLHSGDLSGLILDGDEEFVHLCLPMRHDERRHCVTVVLPQYDDSERWQDPRTEPDELMWPERFGDAEVSRLEVQLGPFMASGRLQQSPIPKGGAIIKRDWWQLWDNDEAKKYGLEWNRERKEFPHCELYVGSLDTSYGEKEENDYNAMTVWGIFQDRNKNQRAMLMYAWARRLPLHGTVVSAKPGEIAVQFKARKEAAWGLVELIADTCRRYRIQRLLIEDKTRGHDVANEIRRLYERENWGVELLSVAGDKVSRAHSVVPLFADGAIFAPETKWAEDVIAEVELFPKGEHDDRVDSTTQFLNWARVRGLLQRADESAADLEDELTFKGRQESVAEIYGV